MSTIYLKVITPTKKVLDQEVISVTAPSVQGDITILPRHANLFTLLKEGIVTIRTTQDEDFMAIGGGYLETDGKTIQILVSRAYNQNEIDQELTEKALANAKKILEETKDHKQRIEAESIMRRSIVSLKLLKKRKRSPSI